MASPHRQLSFLRIPAILHETVGIPILIYLFISIISGGIIAERLIFSDIYSVTDKGSLNLYVQGLIANEIQMSLKFYKNILKW